MCADMAVVSGGHLDTGVTSGTPDTSLLSSVDLDFLPVTGFR